MMEVAMDTRSMRWALMLGAMAVGAAAAPLRLVAQSGMPSVARRDTLITEPTRAPRTPLASAEATQRLKRFSFIAYGDTRGRADGTALQVEHGRVVASMLETIKAAEGTKDPIRFVLQSGDAVVNGSIATQLNVSYIPLINRLTQEGNVPYLLSVGNHDVGTSMELTDTRRRDGLHNFFTTNRELLPPVGPQRLAGYPTYVFGYGNTFFVAFDSNIPDDTVQFAWVSRQLDQLDRRRYRNIVVFYHHPAYSSGPHGGPTLEPQAMSVRARWMPLFRKHHVRLLLTGHEHFYEHFVERYRDGSGAHRMDQVVSGGGGAPLYPYRGMPDLTAYKAAAGDAAVQVEQVVRPASEGKDNVYHYVVVHVDGERITLEVIGVDAGASYAPYNGTRRTTLTPR
jgi:hypothetical protein